MRASQRGGPGHRFINNPRQAAVAKDKGRGEKGRYMCSYVFILKIIKNMSE
jgi:hypothetical protein